LRLVNARSQIRFARLAEPGWLAIRLLPPPFTGNA
jgi:hypothetical protein